MTGLCQSSSGRGSSADHGQVAPTDLQTAHLGLVGHVTADQVRPGARGDLSIFPRLLIRVVGLGLAVGLVPNDVDEPPASPAGMLGCVERVHRTRCAGLPRT